MNLGKNTGGERNPSLAAKGGLRGGHCLCNILLRNGLHFTLSLTSVKMAEKPSFFPVQPLRSLVIVSTTFDG